jgi:BASS family bile acid:Na+ symporter
VTNPFTQVFLPLAIVLVMFALGTTLGGDDLRRVLRAPRAFLLGALLHVTLLPAAAFALGVWLDVEPRTAAGLVIIASCPANSVASLFTHFARGDTMLAVCLTAATSALSVATIPSFVSLALRTFAIGQGTVELPVGKTVLGVFLIATLPVIVGMAVRRRRPDVARKVEAKLTGFGLAFVLTVIVFAVWSERANVPPALLQSGALALLLNFAAVGSAWGLSALGHPASAAHRDRARERAAELRDGRFRLADPARRRAAAPARDRLRPHDVALRRDRRAARPAPEGVRRQASGQVYWQTGVATRLSNAIGMKPPVERTTRRKGGLPELATTPSA